MNRGIEKVYADTSVYGGIGDEGFRAASEKFFNAVRSGRFQLVMSEIIRREISIAPDYVRRLLDEMIPMASPVAVITEEALNLRDRYIESGVVSRKWTDDALHVAVATINECSMIVSWNFRHIVHYRKMELYNAVNVLAGYHHISIHSPLEIMTDEDATEEI
ncbi:MAG TPA: hypothetical protein PL033_15545 [Candidatus Brocadiia bacterium]|nr:hypothetical protein [Candidatus Brocadiia bacterium]